MRRRLRIADLRSSAVLFFFVAAAAASAQTTGAQLVKQPKPVYPEAASKGLRQGNVNLIGRIDTAGKVKDLRYVGSTLEIFLEPAVAAVNGWEFRPATRGGKPVEIAANIALRFRLQGENHGEIASPMIGDLAVYPADATGRASGPEGFPIRRGTDKKMHVEAVLDVSPDPKSRTLPLTVEAISPIGNKTAVYQASLQVKPKASEVKIPFTVPVGIDWEDGVWLLRFVADKTEAGGGQFWVAVDPEHYQFVLPGKPLIVAAKPAAAAAPAASAKPSGPPRSRATAVPKK